MRTSFYYTFLNENLIKYSIYLKIQNKRKKWLLKFANIKKLWYKIGWSFIIRARKELVWKIV